MFIEKIFDIREINTNLRPSKVATIIRKGSGWQKNCLNIIEAYSQIWGGNQNLIVPTDGHKIEEIFWDLLEKFDPDYIYIYYNPKEGFKGISKKLEKEIEQNLNPFFSELGESIIYDKHFMAVGNPYPLTFLPDIIPNIEFKRMEIHPTIIDHTINYGIKDQPDIILLMFYSVMGKLNKDYSDVLKEKADVSTHINDLTKDSLLKILDGIWKNRIINQDYTPYVYSMVRIKPYLRDIHDYHKAPFIIVTGDTIEDYCLYYNLSKMRDDVVWAPFSIIKESNKELIKKDKSGTSHSRLLHFNNILLHYMYDMILNDNLKGIITSFSKSKDDLESIIDILIKTCSSKHVLLYVDSKYEKEIRHNISISKNLDELLPYKFVYYEEDNYDNIYVEQFIEGKSINPIKTPIPRQFSHRSFDRHYWISDVSIKGYNLPQFSFLNEIAEYKHFSNSTIRISDSGIAYMSPNTSFIGLSIDKNLIRPHITISDPFKLFEKIFSENGYYIKTSDKGNYARESAEKFGSIGKLAVFLSNTYHQRIFDKFTVEKDPKTGDNIFLKDDKRNYLKCKTIGRFLSSENVSINELIENGILHRGFIFKCEKCKFAGWYDIEDVNNTFKCRRCRNIQFYNSSHLFKQNSIEPEWFYKLDEAIFQGYTHNMIVPILTIQTLKKSSKDTFLFIDEIELKKDDKQDKPNKELDVCCIVDGKLIIGECKINNKLGSSPEEESQIIKEYKKFYHKINADKLIFATFDSKGWSKGTEKRLEEFLDDIHYELYKRDKNVYEKLNEKEKYTEICFLDSLKPY